MRVHMFYHCNPLLKPAEYIRHPSTDLSAQSCTCVAIGQALSTVTAEGQLRHRACPPYPALSSHWRSLLLGADARGHWERQPKCRTLRRQSVEDSEYEATRPCDRRMRSFVHINLGVRRCAGSRLKTLQHNTKLRLVAQRLGRMQEIVHYLFGMRKARDKASYTNRTTQ